MNRSADPARIHNRAIAFRMTAVFLTPLSAAYRRGGSITYHLHPKDSA